MKEIGTTEVSCYFLFLFLATPQEKSNSSGRQKQGVRSNDREHNERQGEKLDNRRQGDDRPPRASRGGGRPRLSSREKDRVSRFSKMSCIVLKWMVPLGGGGLKIPQPEKRTSID